MFWFAPLLPVGGGASVLPPCLMPVFARVGAHASQVVGRRRHCFVFAPASHVASRTQLWIAGRHLVIKLSLEDAVRTSLLYVSQTVTVSDTKVDK